MRNEVFNVRWTVATASATLTLRAASEKDSMSSEGEKRQIGPFQLEKKLGVGGMGIVYLGTYLKTGAKVAVKVLAPDLSGDPQVAARFDREMEILKKLKDPHIVRYYGGSSTRTQRYYAMELVTGGSLDKILRKEGKLPWETVVEYGIQAAKALEHAHREGVIHRDLKPGNLLLTEKGVLKLSDFGIARDTQATALTAAGKTVGTMAYMAPEQITGKKPVTARTDLYALGCVLFELLTGRTPFASETQPEMLFKHIDEIPPKVREFAVDCPVWLEDLVDDLLQKEPEDRPFDALDVQVKLDRIKQKVTEADQKRFTQEGQSAVTAREETVAKLLAKEKAKKARKKKQREQVPLWERTWFLCAVLAVIVGACVWGFWPASEQDLYDTVRPLMASDDSSDWYNAERDLKRMLARYPEGEHAGEARLWLAQIEMDRAEKRADHNAEWDFEPDSEAERLYVEAREFERYGDRMLAREKYLAMQRLLADDEESRPYLNLARRQVERIEGSLGSDTDRFAFVRSKLDEADQLYRDGNTMGAEQRWDDIIKLYGDLSEFELLVGQAHLRKADPRTALENETE
jgi:serine/threonine-protein kinase